jgi:hypothetical protein
MFSILQPVTIAAAVAAAPPSQVLHTHVYIYSNSRAAVTRVERFGRDFAV